MTIQSLSYLLFVVLVWVAIWPLRSARSRQALFLVASYLFYATLGLGFLAVLIASSLMNYLLGVMLRRRPTAGRLWIGISLNMLLLMLFKYLPQMTVGPASNLLPKIIMPVGVSFWTFQALSYLFDLYREEELDPSLVEFCLYMAFWPTVLSGPVCRLPDMLPQFRETARPAWDDVAEGTRRIIIGLFMKVVLAQLLVTGFNAGEGVAAGFDQIARGWGGIDVWLLAIGFGFQLFFDFAGYSHIVIGTARLFGIRLEENFNRPYFSLTPSVFWTRWHMSLSFWIRDYVFLPLATARREKWWRSFVLVFAMALFGLWHEATLLFLIWGIYQGLLLVAHRKGQQLKRTLNFKMPRYMGTSLSWALTFALISLGWIFFRAHDLDQALLMMKAVVSPASYFQLALRPNFYIVTSLVVCGYFAYVGLESLLSRLGENLWARRAFRLLSPLYYAMAIFFIIVWSKQETVFVYFQF
ncbi:MAG TPA: MBOAT family O-acyltransferase [Blastocatellia bacterium]|nr:MBOAT family O-acyltransferase [Blastocatellia bacterium]